MSSVAGRVGATRLAAARARAPAIARRLSADAALSLAIGALLAALAFTAQGGSSVEANTWAEIVIVAIGSSLAAAAIAAPMRHARVERLHGGASLLAIAGLTLLTALSVIWSIAPSDSWLESNRMLSYLAAFAGALGVVRLAPGRWAALLQGIALASVAVCGWALLTKVFPSLSPDEIFARLRAPFGYWNAVGLMAALGVPPLLWLAARRSGHAAINALAYPALGLLLVCMLLAYSRGALLALAVGLMAWFTLVPLRLRGAVALIAAGAASGLLVAWAFDQKGLTEDNIAGFERAHAGHELGLLLALMIVLLLALGLAVGFATAARAPSQAARLLAGRMVLGALAAAVLAVVVGLAASPGGIDGQVSKAWKQLTDVNARTPANTPDRLTATASVRARYWREAIKVHGQSPAVGVGAGGYATARKHFRTSNLDVQHAHGYIVQVLADLGWVGLAISIIALAAWLDAAARVVGLRREHRGLPWDAERVGMATLATVVLVFGAHSFLDWTWSVPATAVTALLCAAWVAGRAPLRERLAAEGPTGIIGAAERAGMIVPRPRWTLRERLLRWQPDAYRSVVALVVLIAAMAICWTIVQPLRAIHAGDAAVARMQANSFGAAADIARIGTKRNPLSVEPWWELATAQAAAGDLAEAQQDLERAVTIQPANAEAWRRLGRFRLSALNRPAQALEAFRAAYYLDPQSPDSTSDVIEASRALQAAGGPPP